ncbi:MAG: formyltetrahydrofolate deformylase, partial [Novosphingobium sp.]
MARETLTLKLSCPDKPGLVSGVTRVLADNGGNILEAEQFNDTESQRFFMRLVFEPLGDTSLDLFARNFALLAADNAMEWSLRSSEERRKVLLLVSKFDHCLGDLLYRYRIGELPMDVVGIIGNHPREALKISLIGDTPYFHLPITKETKPEQEAQIKRVVNETGAELVVLARYMQILSDDLATFLSGRCINIHHSFLPGFKG